MARFAARNVRRLTLVSKLVPDTNLFARPPRRNFKANGRSSIKGCSLPSPKDVANSGKRGRILRVRWYGGGWRNVHVFTDVGHWYNSGKGLVEIRWVYIIDLDGTHGDECFFTTDVAMSPSSIPVVPVVAP
jgi:hypothetical protein